MTKIMTALLLTGAACMALQAANIETKVALWQNNSKGAYVMLIDDGCDSAIDKAIPELVKREMPATFYICPNWDNFKAKRADWESAMREHPYLALGNHTFSHAGGERDKFVPEVQKGDQEVRAIAQLDADALVSFAVPGNRNDIKLTDAELDKVLADHNEVLRIDINENIAGRTHETAEDLIGDIDIAEEEGMLSYILFHGIGGDWFNFPIDQFEIVLDDLAYRRQERRIWPATMIAVQKYIKERDGAKIRRSDLAGDKITVDLQLSTDPKQYNEPLTLVTKAPEGWTGATVKQGGAESEAELVGGELIYNVSPVSGAIELTKK